MSSLPSFHLEITVSDYFGSTQKAVYVETYGTGINNLRSSHIIPVGVRHSFFHIALRHAIEELKDKMILDEMDYDQLKKVIY
jgi:hypothetical protein